jgi:hypothetical protein
LSTDTSIRSTSAFGPDSFFGPSDPSGSHLRQFPAWANFELLQQRPEVAFEEKWDAFMQFLEEQAFWLENRREGGGFAFMELCKAVFDDEIGSEDVVTILQVIHDGSYTPQLLSRYKLLALARKALGS